MDLVRWRHLSCVETARAYHRGVRFSHEICHALLPPIHKDRPIGTSPDSELADGEVFLCAVVRADGDWLPFEFVTAWWLNVCPESKPELSLLSRQAIVRNVLLCSRLDTEIRINLLFCQKANPQFARGK